MTDRRPSSSARGVTRPSDSVSTAEYLTLVVLLAAALVGTALFVGWAMQTRGILSPGTVPGTSSAPTFDSDYEAPDGPVFPAE